MDQRILIVIVSLALYLGIGCLAYLTYRHLKSVIGLVLRLKITLVMLSVSAIFLILHFVGLYQLIAVSKIATGLVLAVYFMGIVAMVCFMVWFLMIREKLLRRR